MRLLGAATTRWLGREGCHQGLQHSRCPRLGHGMWSQVGEQHRRKVCAMSLFVSETKSPRAALTWSAGHVL